MAGHPLWFFFGSIIVLAGIAGFVSLMFPYRVAKFEEQLDAIGSQREIDDVEPEEWRIWGTRGMGLLILFLVYLIIVRIYAAT